MTFLTFTRQVVPFFGKDEIVYADEQTSSFWYPFQLVLGWLSVPKELAFDCITERDPELATKRTQGEITEFADLTLLIEESHCLRERHIVLLVQGLNQRAMMGNNLLAQIILQYEQAKEVLLDHEN